MMRGRISKFLKGAGMLTVLLALLSRNVLADEDATIQLTENGIVLGTSSTDENSTENADEVVDDQSISEEASTNNNSDTRNSENPEDANSQDKDPNTEIMTLDEPRVIEEGKVNVTGYDSSRGIFRVMISGIRSADQVKEVLVPVWSEVGGQDDIQWYRAVRSSSGDYYADVDIRNHRYSMGIYKIHAYITDKEGKQTYYGSATQEVTFKQGKLTVRKSRANEYVAELTGISIPGGVKNIQFPAWSQVNGQDDIRWYTLENNGSNTYRCKISIADHKGLGKYSVHAYAQMPDNSLIFLGSSGFETEAPSVGSVQASVGSNAGGQFQVKISGVRNEGLIRQIQVPVWSENNQGDIVWYTAAGDGKGNYFVNANIANHKYNCGKYNIHAYIQDVTGALQFVGATSVELKPGYQTISAVDVSGTESTYRITLSGLVVPGGERNVKFPVWGVEGGQNDIRWYNASRQSNGTYIADVQITNHREFGKYVVHGYYETLDGSLHFIGATGFEVTKRPMAAQVQITDVNRTAGSFRVMATGVTSLAGIERVRIPVWCAGDQSDIVWYTASKVSEGVYAVNVKVSQHMSHFGNYKAHVYVIARNGGQAFVGGASASISPLNYVYTHQISSTQQEVGILGASGSRVQFPTWSNQNGQDDIVWYEGVNRGNGKWNTVVDSARHSSGGAYTTHVYISSGNSMNGFGAVSYSLYKVPTQQGQMLTRANMYSSPTPYLLMVNRSTHKVGVFQKGANGWDFVHYWDCGDGAPGTPTVEGVFSVGSKGYYFDSGAARCYWYTQFRGNYLFHSVLYNKNGTLQDGRVGMALSHGCVRLLIENAKWIYDTIPAGTTVVVYH